MSVKKDRQYYIHAFSNGMGASLDIFGLSLDEKELVLIESKALERDWRAVGNTMWYSIDGYANQNHLSNPRVVEREINSSLIPVGE